jgi:hypothetical protein
LAREGCKKAIRSWELREKAIRAAEALISKDEKAGTRNFIRRSVGFEKH